MFLIHAQPEILENVRSDYGLGAGRAEDNIAGDPLTAEIEKAKAIGQLTRA
ncbi:MAG TPA: hypothetical protein PLN61_07480 [bacterium]|nr:hypothetical protein [bacterium]HQJ65786.1 hypothetical protein [bacterium]